jgi:hypothetical protein
VGTILTVALLIAVVAVVFAMKGVFLQIVSELFEHPMKRRRRLPNSDPPDDSTPVDASAASPPKRAAPGNL